MATLRKPHTSHEGRQPRDQRSPAKAGARPDGLALRIASLNVAGEKDPDRILKDLSTIEELSKADVLLLQEAEYVPIGRPRSIRKVASTLGMKWAYAAEKLNRDGTAMALAILSRHRLSNRERRVLKTFDRVVLQRERIALGVTVHLPGCKVRVVNLHMDTRINTAQRRDQLESALELLHGFNGPQVIGGDFNTADIYWFKHVLPVPFRERQGHLVKVGLEEKGFHTPFDGKSSTIRFWGFQLDWIFTRGLVEGASSILKVPFSDHHAVYVECKVPQMGWRSIKVV